LFLLIGLFKILGISYRQSYLIFLALYYFIGMIGFYLVAFRIFNDRLTAFTAYLLLMFSSLATRLFDSYIVYEFVPMVWFFYFFIAFLQDFKKHFFVGSIFTILIILTTYIPFYFIIIFFIVSICFFGFYFYCLQHIFSSLYKFIKNNKLLIFTSIIVLLLFLLPGLLMVKSCTGSEILLQSRHAASDSSNQMEVGYKTITNWGVLEDIFYSTSFPDFRRFKFAILYVPLFSYILFALGIFTHIN